MKNQLISKYIGVIFLMLSQNIFSQVGTITGTLTDDSGLPLPGVNIIIKGTDLGTQTDFDGIYSIDCNIGDILVFNYVGFGSREVVVTYEMFGDNSNTSIVKKETVVPIHSSDYASAVQQGLKTEFIIPNIENSKYTYNKNVPLFAYNRIRDMNIKKDNNKVKLTYFKPDIFYEVGWNTSMSLQFVKQSNLPELQNVFSQGQPLNGQNTFFGPENDIRFSYGPRLSSLRFDGTAYPYDQNGRLTGTVNNNGKDAIAYDNSIFETVTKTTNTLFFNLSTDRSVLGLEYRDKRTEDVFEKERSCTNEISISYNNPQNTHQNVRWNTHLKYSQNVDNQPNLNGFLNNVLLNNWATPPSFENNQGATLVDGTQRSFNVSNFNNPLWALEINRNQVKHNSFLASFQNRIKLSDDASIQTNFNYINNINKQNFGLTPNTVGFIDGYSSDKNFRSNKFNASGTFKIEKNQNRTDLYFTSTASYGYDYLEYTLTEKTGFDLFSFNNPNAVNSVDRILDRNTFQWLNKLKYTISDWDAMITIANSSFISSIQNSKWFLPVLQFEMDLQDHIDRYWVNKLGVSANVSFEAKDTPLYYANQSHNSLNITPEQSQAFISNDDLFITNDLQLEEKMSYSLGTLFNFQLFNKSTSLAFTYYNHNIKKSVFPVLDQGNFQLQNIANIQKYGFEGSMDVALYHNTSFSYAPGIVFSLYRNKVSKILGDQERIPIAGFSTVSKNLIAGQPAGILVGTAYARDDQNNVIIGSDGFPLVAEEPQIIGDPTPDFAIGFSNDFNWKGYTLSFLIDLQKGGDVWNGTQNVLNYLGRSQQSAEEREISGFLFDGVNQQGQTNVIPVDFANPADDISENRFVRYGFEGVAEEAIVDGSYINLKSINLSYTFKQRSVHDFIRALDIGVYANNLFTYSKFRGLSPYSSLFDHTSGQSLQFFNTPITSEIGLQIKIKL